MFIKAAMVMAIISLICTAITIAGMFGVIGVIIKRSIAKSRMNRQIR